MGSTIDSGAEFARRVREMEEDFRWLEGRLASGHIDIGEYRAALESMRVNDGWGRPWMMQERTGQWHVWHEGAWVPATPPVASQHAAPAMPPPETGAAPQGANPPPTAHQASTPAEKPGCTKYLLYGLAWGVTWVIIAAVVLFLSRDSAEPLHVLAGVGLGALLSLLLLIVILMQNWSGHIEDIYSRQERVNDSDDSYHYVTVWYATVRQDNGRKKKVRWQSGWEVGDRLEKHRGETTVRVIKR